MGRRFLFKYHNQECRKTYTLFRDNAVLSKIIVQCPYYLTETVADLSPYANDLVEIYRKGFTGQQPR